MITVCYYNDPEEYYDKFIDIDNKEQVKEINCSDQQIESLEGIELLINLKILDCSYNNIKDLSPIRNLIKLEHIDCSSIAIDNFNDLINLKNLEVLIGHELRLISIEPLKYLTKLKKLYLVENNITDLTPIKDLINLTELYCPTNHISDLTPLKNLINLTDIFIDDNYIKDLTPIKDLINLKIFSSCGFNIEIIPIDIINLTNLECFQYNTNIELHPSIIRFTNIIQLRRTKKVMLYDDKENVHNSSIQKSVKESIIQLLKDDGYISKEDLIKTICDQY